MAKQDDENYSAEEAARRRDEVIRRMANTPPQPRVMRPSRRPKKEGTTGLDRGARIGGRDDKKS
jgi:hypothetical protein